MTSEEFKIGYATLINAFALSDKTSPQTQDIYWERLKTFPGYAFMNAVTICLDECEFFPTIAKIKEAANRKSFDTGALKQMQLDPPMPKEQGIKLLKDLMAKLPDKPTLKVCDEVPWERSKVQNETNFAQFDREWSVVKLPCARCGCWCLLPFADGGDKTVLCEDCNREEAR